MMGDNNSGSYPNIVISPFLLHIYRDWIKDEKHCGDHH